MLSPNSYLRVTANYIDEQEEHFIYPLSSRELTSNFLIVLLKLFKDFADLISLGSFACIDNQMVKREMWTKYTYSLTVLGFNDLCTVYWESLHQMLPWQQWKFSFLISYV